MIIYQSTICMDKVWLGLGKSNYLVKIFIGLGLGSLA